MYLHSVWKHCETDPLPLDIYIFQPHFLSQNYSLNWAGWSSTPSPKMDKLFCGNKHATAAAAKNPTLKNVISLSLCKDTVKWAKYNTLPEHSNRKTEAKSLKACCNRQPALAKDTAWLLPHSSLRKQFWQKQCCDSWQKVLFIRTLCRRLRTQFK